MTAQAQEPIWLSLTNVPMLHAESLNYFGGLPGVRDEGLLESAIDRPRNKFGLGNTTDLFELAAAYGFGIAKNHAFMDGNKRTALLSIRAFLFRNGYSFAPKETETVTMIEGLAAGGIDEDMLARWIGENSSRLT
ncbi:MAG: death-on-curing protein [Rhodothermales bacterium]|jgi:death-on-curing protein